MRTSILAGPTIALTALLAGTAAQADVKVGVTAAVNPQAIGQPPTEPERVLLVGSDNFANEKITTGPNGQVQLLFVDGSSISVGPDANLKIDEYVYDPNTKTGKLAVTAAQGVFRIVGGAISKASEVTITTPTMTAGIRGGIGVFSPSSAAFLFGSFMRVTANGGTQEMTRPGFQVTVPPGQPPLPPVRMSADEVRASLGQFQGRRAGAGPAGQAGQAGGDEPREDAALAKSGVSSATGSRLTPNNIGPAHFVTHFNPNTNAIIRNIAPFAGNPIIGTGGGGPAGDPLFGHFYSGGPYTAFDPQTGFATYDPSTTGNVLFTRRGSTLGFSLPVGNGLTQNFSLPFRPGQIYSTGNIALRNGGTANGTVMVAPDPSQFFVVLGTVRGINCGSNSSCGFGFFGGKPTQTTASSRFPNSGFAISAALGLQTDPNKGPTKVPFTGGFNTPAPGSSGLTISPMFTAFGGTQQPGTPAASTNLQASLWIQGTGANQSSGLVGMTSVYFAEQNSTTAFAGGVVGMKRDSAGSTLDRYASGAMSAPTAPPSRGLTNGNAIYGANANYAVIVPDIATPIPNAPDTRTPGAAQTIDFPNLQSRGPEFWATAVVQNGFSSTTFAPRTDTTPGSASGYLRGYAGGLMDIRSTAGTITTGMFGTTPADLATQGPGVFIGTNPSTNTLGAVFNFRDLGNNDAYRLQFGNNTGNFGTRSAFINDLIFASRESRDVNGNPLSTFNGSTAGFSRLFMVSSNVAPIDFQSFAGQGVTACTCEFMRWGWWIGEVTNPNGVHERFHLATWVAGVLPSPGQVQALNGTFDYRGHVIGNVSTGGFNYVAAGNLLLHWNFSERSGTWTASNFDRGGRIMASGFGFSGPVSAGNARDFSSSSSLMGPFSSTGSAIGSFYKGGNDVAAGAGGSWYLNNAAFKAAGTFAGRR